MSGFSQLPSFQMNQVGGQAPASEPRRRRFRYSLAGLMLFTTFVAVLCSILFTGLGERLTSFLGKVSECLLPVPHGKYDLAASEEPTLYRDGDFSTRVVFEAAAEEPFTLCLLRGIEDTYGKPETRKWSEVGVFSSRPQRFGHREAVRARCSLAGNGVSFAEMDAHGKRFVSGLPEKTAYCDREIVAIRRRHRLGENVDIMTYRYAHDSNTPDHGIQYAVVALPPGTSWRPAEEQKESPSAATRR